MSLNVVEFPNTNLTDVPAKLRDMADLLESGDFGTVGTCAVVVLADTLEVYGFGPESSFVAVHTVLHAGMMKLATALVQHGAPQ